MSENIKEENFLEEGEENEKSELEKYEPAIRRFLKEQFGGSIEDKGQKYSFEFDISVPHAEDMKNIRLGNFEITNFRTSPSPNPDESDKLNFHFYIGETEFHISGKAADRVRELMEEE